MTSSRGAVQDPPRAQKPPSGALPPGNRDVCPPTPGHCRRFQMPSLTPDFPFRRSCTRCSRYQVKPDHRRWCQGSADQGGAPAGHVGGKANPDHHSSWRSSFLVPPQCLPSATRKLGKGLATPGPDLRPGFQGETFPTELRQKIQSIPTAVPRPLALASAKAVLPACSFVQNIPATKENLAAGPAPVGPMPTPGWRRWSLGPPGAGCGPQGPRGGAGLPDPRLLPKTTGRPGAPRSSPAPGDELPPPARDAGGTLDPAPSHTFLGAKGFKAGIAVGGRTGQEGEPPWWHASLLPHPGWPMEVELARGRSPPSQEPVFWVVETERGTDPTGPGTLTESDEMLATPAHQTPSRDEGASGVR